MRWRNLSLSRCQIKTIAYTCVYWFALLYYCSLEVVHQSTLVLFHFVLTHWHWRFKWKISNVLLTFSANRIDKNVCVHFNYSFNKQQHMLVKTYTYSTRLNWECCLEYFSYLLMCVYVCVWLLCLTYVSDVLFLRCYGMCLRTFWVEKFESMSVNQYSLNLFPCILNK